MRHPAEPAFAVYSAVAANAARGAALHMLLPRQRRMSRWRVGLKRAPVAVGVVVEERQFNRSHRTVRHNTMASVI